MNKLLIVGIIATIALVTTGTTSQAVQSQPNAPGIKGLTTSEIAEQKDQFLGSIIVDRKAPIAISGENVYIVWPTNKTGNDEVNFRASTDGGTTFGDKINLSNSTDADSQDVEIAADGDNVIITWWERNQTAEEPVLRMSSDNGATFGPLLQLATNGTIGEAQ